MRESLLGDKIKPRILDYLSTLFGYQTQAVHISEDVTSRSEWDELIYRGLLTIRVIRGEGDVTIAISSMNEESTKAGPFMYMVDWMSLSSAVAKLL
ncbi:hypothetical protein A2368_03775 [Candidatus Collierbacteria bacterium RIFOXYB1_FULL_49_13]|uniref:Uncharacterized protein n=1 Tax=Candidatus Collierbacteria bacterium RIFOXYB1_FULL_49_13 TaxID=1817728 RepID=A0A1F5FIW4_9BACT|nr:MAG: hypothetical protein A2368_03775 [Candidatus Collierbacteria bacterium RIFOXYB1_FULL_49_13]